MKWKTSVVIFCFGSILGCFVLGLHFEDIRNHVQDPKELVSKDDTGPSSVGAKRSIIKRHNHNEEMDTPNVGGDLSDDELDRLAAKAEESLEWIESVWRRQDQQNGTKLGNESLKELGALIKEHLEAREEVSPGSSPNESITIALSPEEMKRRFGLNKKFLTSSVIAANSTRPDSDDSEDSTLFKPGSIEIDSDFIRYFGNPYSDFVGKNPWPADWNAVPEGFMRDDVSEMDMINQLPLTGAGGRLLLRMTPDRLAQAKDLVHSKYNEHKALKWLADAAVISKDVGIDSRKVSGKDSSFYIAAHIINLPSEMIATEAGTLNACRIRLTFSTPLSKSAPIVEAGIRLIFDAVASSFRGSGFTSWMDDFLPTMHVIITGDCRESLRLLESYIEKLNNFGSTELDEKAFAEALQRLRDSVRDENTSYRKTLETDTRKITVTPFFSNSSLLNVIAGQEGTLLDEAGIYMAEALETAYVSVVVTGHFSENTDAMERKTLSKDEVFLSLKALAGQFESSFVAPYDCYTSFRAVEFPKMTVEHSSVLPDAASEVTLPDATVTSPDVATVTSPDRAPVTSSDVASPALRARLLFQVFEDDLLGLKFLPCTNLMSLQVIACLAEKLWSELQISGATDFKAQAFEIFNSVNYLSFDVQLGGEYAEVESAKSIFRDLLFKIEAELDKVESSLVLQCMTQSQSSLSQFFGDHNDLRSSLVTFLEGQIRQELYAYTDPLQCVLEVEKGFTVDGIRQVFDRYVLGKDEHRRQAFAFVLNKAAQSLMSNKEPEPANTETTSGDVDEISSQKTFGGAHNIRLKSMRDVVGYVRNQPGLPAPGILGSIRFHQALKG